MKSNLFIKMLNGQRSDTFASIMDKLFCISLANHSAYKLIYQVHYS